MTPKEALELLDRAVATITTDRNTHAKLQEAIMVLNNLIKNKENEK